MEVRGQLAGLSCLLPLCRPGTAEEFMWFSCIAPMISIFSYACWPTAANHTKCNFQDILKTNLMAFKRSLHSGQVLPCISLRGQLVGLTMLKASLPSTAASCQTGKETRVVMATVVQLSEEKDTLAPW